MQLFLFLIYLCVFINQSSQDLYKLALEQGLSIHESDLVRRYELKRFGRQSGNSEPYVTKSGISQSRTCGINGKSISRVRREGEDTPHGSEDWPWMALLLSSANNYAWFCGGVLLNSRYVLTAAHCFEMPETKDKENIVVRLGEYDIRESEETQIQEFSVVDLKIHPDYESATYQHDIAVLKLNGSVKYSQYVRPVCLPNIEPKANESAIVAGWGRTSSGGTTSNVLLYVPIPVWDHLSCVDALISPVHDTNICAAAYDGGGDACQVDSGGPLMYQEDKRWVTVGIVSWGMGCGDSLPGVYTSVLKYLEWIGKYIKDVPE